MIITIASYKGGVGKTTSGIHIASYLHQRGPTLLIDGDPNRSAMVWARKGQLPFKVIDERQMAKFGRGYEHYVLDTQARPSGEDLKELAEGCDLLIIPTEPDRLSLDALRRILATITHLDIHHYKVLITKVPPWPSREGDDARAALTEAGLPLFRTSIRLRAAFRKAADDGVPVSAINTPGGREGWSDYGQIGQEILP